MPRKQGPRQRAVRGSVAADVHLRMPAHLAALAEHAAGRSGVSVAEWWRRAGLAAIAAQVGHE